MTNPNARHERDTQRGRVMEPIVDPGDFPASRECAYLNTASVALMYKGAETATVEWLREGRDF